MTKQFFAQATAVFLITTVCADANPNSHTHSTVQDEIIVSGARTPADLSQLASALTVIERDEIERRQSRHVADLLRSVPGFSVSHTGVAGSQTQVRVRGAEANHVLVMIDGVRANDPATGDEFRWEHLSTANIERIEIVRGPHSALWGSDAVAAVVHIITRTGATQPGGSAYAETGSNSALNIGASGSLPIAGWVFDAGAERLSTDGENISRVGSENDAADLTTLSLGASYSNDETTVLNFGLRATDAESHTDPVDFFVTGLPVDGDQKTQSDSLQVSALAAWEQQGGRIGHTIRAAYVDTGHDNFVAGNADSSTASERTTLGLQSDFELGLNLLTVAIEHEDTDFEQRGAVLFGDPNQDQDMRITSLVAEYRFLGNERFNWTVGGRFDSNSEFDDVVTGRIAATFEARANTRLRASIGTGHKTPTFTERFGFFPAQFVGNPDLKPETSVSFDVGIDQSLLDGNLSFSAALFAQKLEDEINGFVFDPVTFLGTAQNRDSESSRSGIELNGRWQVNDNIALSGSYTYTDASEEDATGTDIRELRRPRNSGSATIDFVSDDNTLGIMVVGDFGGRRNDLFFAPFPAPVQTVELDSHVLLDLTVRYQLSPAVSLYVRGSNLLDDDYEQVYGYRTQGRSGYFGVKASFGR